MPSKILFVGAGPGDPELLTLRAARAIAAAEVILHDRLIASEVLALADPQAALVDVGKHGFGHATPQEVINALLVRHGRSGARVVRLKSGDPTVFGRLDEEMEALEAAGLPFEIVPGITAASAAVADLGQSLTRRGRNSQLTLVTGHDMQGFAEQDWRALARPGAVAAIYMGKRSARFIQGRLLMHGAAPATPVSFVEDASRATARVFAGTLASMSGDLDAARAEGPVLMLFGLAPRHAAHAAIQAEELA